jgi:hypothetical protein
MHATSTPTVCASQKSCLGPVTASKERRCSSGQIPVARKYAPWARTKGSAEERSLRAEQLPAAS